jgi:hypothetical protein
VVGKTESKNHLEDLDVDGMIILKWIVKKYMIGEVDWIDLARGREVAGPCECENGNSISTKRGEFFCVDETVQEGFCSI